MSKYRMKAKTKVTKNKKLSKALLRNKILRKKNKILALH